MTTITQDKYRPKFHFTPPFGWMNDPNGLVYVNDEFHLFYQFHPYSTVWGPMHWGHATSPDLIHWQHRPIALKPDEAGACFSGSAIVDTDNDSKLFSDKSSQSGVVAFYTANKECPEGGNSIQSQHIAYSTDGGQTLTKLSDQPIIPNPGLIDFRDPKVFKHTDSDAWIMVVSEGQDIGIYRSTNLLDWQQTSIFGRNYGAHDDFAWECPDLFPITNTTTGEISWVLIIGVQQCGPTGGTGTQYFVGSFDGYIFQPFSESSETLWLDLGRDFYATQSWAGLQGEENIAIAWMSNGLYANGLPTEDWRGAMTMPRGLTLSNTETGPRLSHHIPKSGYKHKETILSKSLCISGPQVFPLGIEQLGITQLDIAMQRGSIIEYRPFGNNAIIFTFVRDSTGYQMKANRNILDDNGEDNYLQNFAYESCITFSDTDQIDLTHISDACSSELLLLGGLYSFTNLVFSAPISPATLTLIAGDITINNISFYQP